jgi:16S rRNA (adenine1518-N6/adenine1519-N6)-dimethyltransferase
MLGKKSLGQHWLKDERALKQIVKLADLKPTDEVLEVGPGLGTLTRFLVEQAQRVVAVELDHNLAAQLTQRLVAKNLKIIEGDILEFDLSKLPVGYKVVANIPYYLTGKLLRRFTETANQPAMIVLLVQKEVAERICAGPGRLSLLAVSVQLQYEFSRGPVLPAALFVPPPKVDSQVVVLKKRKRPPFKNLDQKTFFQIAKAGFSQRRKKLRSSLSAGLQISKEQADELLNRADISGDLRAESLSLEQWYSLYTQYQLKKDLRPLLRPQILD